MLRVVQRQRGLSALSGLMDVASAATHDAGQGLQVLQTCRAAAGTASLLGAAVPLLPPLQPPPPSQRGGPAPWQRSFASSSSDEAEHARKKPGRPLSPVPDIDAAQLVRSLGLEGAADPAAVLSSLRKLQGVRQQGVLDSAAAVATHLHSPAVGLMRQQAGRLLERCPALFSWPPEQRAAVLFGELMGAGLAAAAAAQCFINYPGAVERTNFAAGLAELAAILAHSRDSSQRRQATVPAAQRTVAALLDKRPSAIAAVGQRAGYLRERADKLEQAGFTPADVAALAWDRPEQLVRDAAATVAKAAAVLQQELGLTADEVVSLVASGKPRWVTCSSNTLRERTAALGQGFGRPAAAAIVRAQPQALGCAPAVWWRNLRYMAACGVADPTAVLRQHPQLLHCNHAAAGFVERRLLLQRCFQLTAAQLYEGHSPYLVWLEAPELAQRLQLVEHGGQEHRLVAKAARGGKPRTASGEEHRPALTLVAVIQSLPGFLAAVGASQQEWEAWAAANPAESCPLYRWAQQEAAEEAQRLAAALPPELRPACADSEQAAS